MCGDSVTKMNLEAVIAGNKRKAESRKKWNGSKKSLEKSKHGEKLPSLRVLHDLQYWL